MKKPSIFYAVFIALLFLCGGSAAPLAQDQPQPQTQLQSQTQPQPQPQTAPTSAAPDAVASEPVFRSLLFSLNEMNLIDGALSLRGAIRPLEPGEVEQSMNGLDGVEKPKPENRDVSLGGIVYISNKDWTIWLNGARVTPGALPKEALGLTVRDRLVELQWFDEYTNQIFPIRLRPHQRFNLDTRMFLPGSAE